jgi:hypothetical protein
MRRVRRSLLLSTTELLHEIKRLGSITDQDNLVGREPLDVIQHPILLALNLAWD